MCISSEIWLIIVLVDNPKWRRIKNYLLQCWGIICLERLGWLEHVDDLRFISLRFSPSIKHALNAAGKWGVTKIKIRNTHVHQESHSHVPKLSICMWCFSHLYVVFWNSTYPKTTKRNFHGALCEKKKTTLIIFRGVVADLCSLSPNFSISDFHWLADPQSWIWRMIMILRLNSGVLQLLKKHV